MEPTHGTHYPIWKTLIIMKPTISFLCLFFFSCGYVDDDGDLFEKRITGKIKLVHQKQTEWPNLTFQDSPQSRTGIVENCKAVTYDTLNQRIFVEEYLNPYNSGYYQISVLDTNTLNTAKAYKIYTLEEKRFKSLIQKCNACKTIDMTVN